MAVTEQEVQAALRTVKDPELKLHLVVPGDARNAVLGVEDAEDAEVQPTFASPWTPERIAPLIWASLRL